MVQAYPHIHNGDEDKSTPFLNLVYRGNDECLQEKDMDGWMITVYF